MIRSYPDKSMEDRPSVLDKTRVVPRNRRGATRVDEDERPSRTVEDAVRRRKERDEHG